MNLAVPGGGHTGPGTGWYLFIGALGVAAVCTLVRWHALWLIPVTTGAFAVTYQQWLWDKPVGIPDSGMDAIGYYPTDVVWAMLSDPAGRGAHPGGVLRLFPVVEGTPLIAV